MRELLKDLKWSLILASLLFLFLGIALLIWPHTSNLILCYIVAAVLTAYGLFNIIGYFGKERGSLIGLIVGVICAAFGIYAIVQPTRISDIISVILGVAILVDGAMSLRRDYELRVAGFPQWWVPFAVDVLILILGAIVVFNPGLFAELLLQIIGVILIYESVSDLCQAGPCRRGGGRGHRRAGCGMTSWRVCVEVERGGSGEPPRCCF